MRTHIKVGVCGAKMAVKARLAAMKKAHNDKARREAEEARKREILSKSHKKKNVFFRADSPISNRAKSLDVQRISVMLAAAAANAANAANAAEAAKGREDSTMPETPLPSSTLANSSSSSSPDKLPSPTKEGSKDSLYGQGTTGDVKIRQRGSTFTHSQSSRPQIKSKRRKSTVKRSSFLLSSRNIKDVLPASPSTRAASRMRALSKEKATLASLAEDEEEGEADDSISAEKSNGSDVVNADDTSDGTLAAAYDDTVAEWYYVDDLNEAQGPYDGQTMASWEQDGYLVDRVVCCWRFADGMWMDVKEAVKFFLSSTGEGGISNIDRSQVGEVEAEGDLEQKSGDAPVAEEAITKEGRGASVALSARLVELLKKLSLPTDTSMESLAYLAVSMKNDLEAAKRKIRELQSANSEDSSKSQIVGENMTDGLIGKDSNIRITDANNGKKPTDTQPQKEDLKEGKVSQVLGTELIVVHDDCGNEIRVHEDGRVRISSKKVTDLSAPANEPDLGNLDLKKTKLQPLWSALKALMKDAKQQKSEEEYSPLSWKVFFREPGDPLKMYGQPVAITSDSIARVRDEIINAEMTVPASSSETLKDGFDTELSKEDGGGELSSFRKKLRRQSLKINRRKAERRKSYAVASMRTTLSTLENPEMPEMLSQTEVMKADTLGLSGDVLMSAAQKAARTNQRKRATIDSLFLVQMEKNSEIIPAVVLDE